MTTVGTLICGVGPQGKIQEIPVTAFPDQYQSYNVGDRFFSTSGEIQECVTAGYGIAATFIEITGGGSGTPLLAANNLSDVTSSSAALANLGVSVNAQIATRSVLNAADYGIVANVSGTDYGDLLNQLLMTAELYGAVVNLPSFAPTSVAGPGQVYISRPAVMRANTGIAGQVRSGGAAGLRLNAAANCNVLDFQYTSTSAVAFNASSHAYSAGTVVTYNSDYYVCLVGYTSSATTPNADLYHWEKISQTNLAAVAASTVVTLTTATPQSLPVASITDTQGRSMFSQWGGTDTLIKSGTTYTFTYTGFTGSSLTGVLLTSGSVTTAGSEVIAPVASSGNLISNIALTGGIPYTQSPGSFHHASNFSVAGNTNVLFYNVETKFDTGDGFHSNYVAGTNVAYIGCVSLDNSGSGWQASNDSSMTACQSAYNGLGGLLCKSGTAAFHTDPSCDFNNNGRQPIWFSADTTKTASASSGATTITLSAATTVDAIGQGIYDGASPGAGYIPNNTVILDVTGTGTTVLLSNAITGALSTTAVTIGGTYIWPTKSSNVLPTGCVNTVDGIFYVLKTTGVYGSTTSPDSDTTNWAPVRTAYEWGWGVFIDGSGEHSIQGDIQAHPRGCVGIIGGSGKSASLVSITANWWMANPSEAGPSNGTLIGTPSTPTNLLTPALLGFDNANGVIAMVAFCAQGGGARGTLVDFAGTCTNIDVRMVATDTNYATTVAGTVGTACVVTLNNARVTAPAITTPTLSTGTPAQISTTQAVDLYIDVSVAGTLALAIGPTSTPNTTIVSSQTAVVSMYTVRVPAGWYVEFTGTATIACTAVQCP